MIEAVIFDLDGTLVQTEKLKAISYALALQELEPQIDREAVLDVYGRVVGRSRCEVATALLAHFGLEERVAQQLSAWGAEAPWQALARLRWQYYDAMLNDPDMLRKHRWPHTIALLEAVRRQGCRTALATSSHCDDAQRVLNALGLRAAFDVLLTGEDVATPKPDPEVYLLAAQLLALPPERCLVIEDSPPGVQAGLAAGMQVIAVTTPFTREALQRQRLLPETHMVHEPDHLLPKVRSLFAKDGGASDA